MDSNSWNRKSMDNFWLKSVFFSKHKDDTHVQLVIEGIEQNNYVVDIIYDKIKLGVIQKRDGKVIGIVNEEFTIPGIKDGKIKLNYVEDGVLHLIVRENKDEFSNTDKSNQEKRLNLDLF